MGLSPDTSGLLPLLGNLPVTLASSFANMNSKLLNHQNVRFLNDAVHPVFLPPHRSFEMCLLLKVNVALADFEKYHLILTSGHNIHERCLVEIIWGQPPVSSHGRRPF